MNHLDFFETHPIFTRTEFVSEYTKGGRRSEYTADNILAQHVAKGNLLRVRRGLYAIVPRGVDPARVQIDPYLLTSKLAKDAVVAYHAALQFHGRAYSLSSHYPYLTRRHQHPFEFRAMKFFSVQFPARFRSNADSGGEIKEHRHAGGTVRVTTLERTMVDTLDAPNYGGGWEEIWRSLEAVEFFDLDAVVEYALRLGPALTAARVGFFLEQHRESLIVEDRFLQTLRDHAPSQPRYFDNRREPGMLVKKWNLIVPRRILDREWEEKL